MSNQSYSTDSRIFLEDVLVEMENRLRYTLTGWMTAFKDYLTQLFWNTTVSQRLKIIRFGIIVIFMAFGMLIYYACNTPLVNITLLNDLCNAPHDIFRSIFLIPVIYAALAFRVRGSLLASFVFLCVVLPRAIWDSPYPEPLVRSLVFVAITAFVSLLVALGANKLDKEKENTKLLQFLADCMHKQEGEKQHLAREIHDGSLQVLLDISHGIDALSEVEDRKELKLKLKHLRDKADAVQTGLRQVVTGLHPPILEDLGLKASLEWLANEIAEEKGIEVDIENYGESRRLGDSTELSLFRVAQEALQNAKKYSSATKIHIKLSFRRDKIYLTVQDNGVGFSVPAQAKLAVSKKFGLIGMAERTRIVGGDLRIESSKGKGTAVFVEVPVENVELDQVAVGLS